MGREVRLFKSEERQSRGNVSAFLRELADKLAFLHQHPQQRREMGEAGRRRQLAEFSLDRCAGMIDDLYRRILHLPLPGSRGQA